MIKVLFDTNVILDIALKRESFFENSLNAISLVGRKVIGYINVLTLVNTFYFSRKAIGIEKTRAFIGDLLDTFELINSTKEDCIKALHSDFKDFEDAVQEFSALEVAIEIIVTRNVKDFKHSKLLVLEPNDFIQKIENPLKK